LFIRFIWHTITPNCAFYEYNMKLYRQLLK
jgi:hypothetical protein